MKQKTDQKLNYVFCFIGTGCRYSLFLPDEKSAQKELKQATHRLAQHSTGVLPYPWRWQNARAAKISGSFVVKCEANQYL